MRVGVANTGLLATGSLGHYKQKPRRKEKGGIMRIKLITLYLPISGHRPPVTTGDVGDSGDVGDFSISHGKSGYFNARPYRIGRRDLLVKPRRKVAIKNG